MANKSRRNYTYSLAENMKFFIIITIFIITINVAVSAISIINIRRQNHEIIENSVTLFQEETSGHLNAIQHFLEWTIVKEMLVDTLEETTNDYKQYLTLDSLQIRIANHQYTTGDEYNYFLYFQQQDQFLNASKLTFSYNDYLAIKSFIIQYATSQNRQPFSWQFTDINDSTYMYYIITYNNRTLATFINVNDLLDSLLDINFVKQGRLIITDRNENIIFSSDGHQTIDDSSFYYTLHSYKGEGNNLPYNIFLYTDNFHNYGNLFIFQLFVIITATVVCLILSVLILNMYKKVIRPIQEFSTNLSNINRDSDLLDLQSSRIRELEQTNIQFKNLIHEIKKLKITVYEHELEKKHSQITFLQHQIKPHFYLNCLTTINSMAMLKDYKNIEAMINFTSRYLRYLFQTDKELLCIEYELAHIQAYLDIQQLRLGDFFTYSCSIEESDKNALIPPLLLITFIENTIKHAVATDGSLQIRLSVTQIQQEQNPYLKIDITDSGQGFSKDVLEKLSRSESLDTDGRTHVGIINSMQRLHLLYGDNHKIRFFNEIHGGAHIELIIPYQV